MAEKTTKIKVVIDPKSFSSYEKISGTLEILQKNLDDILAKHPLKVQVQVDLSGVKGKLASLKEDLTVIKEASNIQIAFPYQQEVLSQLDSVKSKLQEIHNYKNLDVRISYENIEKAAQQVSAELKAAFGKLGDSEALQSLDQISQRLERIPGRAKQAMQGAAGQMAGMQKEAQSTKVAISKVADNLNNLGTILLKWSDVATLRDFINGAEQINVILTSLQKKLGSNRLKLTGQLDLKATANAIKHQISGDDSALAVTVRSKDAFVSLTGTLNTQATAAEIDRVLKTKMSQALSASSSKIELTGEGLSVSNEQTAEKSIVSFTEKFRNVKRLFEELKNNDIRSLFAEWNASFATLNIPDSTIQSLEKVSATLGQISRALKTLNAPSVKIESATFDSSINRQIEQVATNAQTQVKNGTQITVSVSSQQVVEAINFAVANVDATKINKISVPAQITNLSEAVNEAIVEAHQVDSSMASLPIAVDVFDLGEQVTAAINQLNNTPDALPKIKLSFDGNFSDTSSLVTQAQEAAAKLEQLIAKTSGETVNTGDVSKRVADISNAVKSANKVLDQFSKRQKDALAAGQGGESKDYVRLEQQLEAAKQALEDFKKLATTGSREDALKFYDENKLADTMSKIRSLTELVKDFYDAANTGRKKGGLSDAKFEEKLAKWETQLNSWNKIYTSVDKEYRDNTGINGTQLKDEINNLSEIRQLRESIIGLENKGPLTDDESQTLKENRNRLRDLISEVEQYIAATKRSRAEHVGNSKETDKVAKAQQRLNDWVEKYEARLKRFPALWQEVQKIQASAASGMDSVELQRQIDSVMMRARAMGVETENIFTKVWERIGFNFRSMVASQGIMLVTSSLREIYENVRNLDAAMTELKKVTDGTASTYTKFLDDATERAQNLGASLTDVVNATSAYARLGYSIEDASELGDIATIYKQVGDDIDSIDDATESLISTMNGFGLEADDAMRIIDAFNEVGNRFPTSSGQIGEGLKRSAAAMSAAGNTLDETIALFTAAQATIQNAESVGTILKTTSMRIRGATTELEEAGLETDGMAESTSKLREEIMALTGGFDILEQGGDAFKSTYDILKGVSEVWDNMTDVSQASLLELLAGKRNGNALAAILNNFEMAEAALETSENSSGSALKEHERVLDSIEGKLSKLSATWQVLSQDTLNTDLVKGVLDFLNGALKLLDYIIDNLGSIPMLIGAIVTSLAPLKKTDKLVSLYRERNQALECRRSSNRRGETSKSWEQLKLAS